MQAETNQEKPLLFTKAVAALRAGISMPTLDAEIASGRLRVTRIRRRVMVHRDDFDAWLARCRGMVGEGPHAA